MTQLIGELAALSTSLLFSTTSTFFTLAGRRVGSVVVNRTRLVLATLWLSLAHLALYRTFLPLEAAPARWFWLALSGVIGLVLGDAFLFQAFIWIGPRLSMLMMSLAPILATLVAWVFLGETLRPGQVAGILITVAGIAWVLRDRPQFPGTPSGIVPPAGAKTEVQSEAQPMEQHNRLRGVLFGLGAATGQALGLITAKLGLFGEFSALSGTLIRMLSATVVLWAITFLFRQARATFQTLAAQRKAVLFLLAGSLTGPFLGVTLSLVAVQNTEVGVASTLMALPPVFLLPISRIVFGEKFGLTAVLGTLVAMFGVALLFLV